MWVYFVDKDYNSNTFTKKIGFKTYRNRPQRNTPKKFKMASGSCEKIRT